MYKIRRWRCNPQPWWFLTQSSPFFLTFGRSGKVLICVLSLENAWPSNLILSIFTFWDKIGPSHTGKKGLISGSSIKVCHSDYWIIAVGSSLSFILCLLFSICHTLSLVVLMTLVFPTCVGCAFYLLLNII